MKRGWKVSLPIGEDCRYDVIVDTSKSLSRVQVKTCERFHLKVRYGKRVLKPYSWRECDVIAVYAMPLNTWWIIPVDKLQGCYLNLSKQYHEFNSAWHLLGGATKFAKKK